MALARYQFTITDVLGNVVPNAHVEVRREISGQPLAAIYSDPDGAVSISNPFDADALGFAFFHAAGGTYRIRAYTGTSGAPLFERIWRYVELGSALATQDDAIIAADATRTITPLRVKQHVDSRLASQAEADAGTDAAKIMSPARTYTLVTTRVGVLQTQLNALTVIGAGGTFGFATKAAMDAALNYAAGTLATVSPATDAANAATYRKLGASGSGSWTFHAPYQDIATVSGRVDVLEAGSTAADLKITSYGAGYTLLANGRIYVATRTDKNGVLLGGETAKGFRDTTIDPRYPDCSHVVSMGQSISSGANAVDYGNPAVTPWGSRKFDLGTHTYNPNSNPTLPQNRVITAFTPLRPDTLTVPNYGQSGAMQANGLCDYLKWSIAGSSANGLGGAPPSFLFSYVGLPGKQMHELSSLNQETNPSQPAAAQGPGGYWITMLNDVARGKALSDERGETYGVLAFMWGQGFSNTGSLNSVLPSRYGAAIAHPAGAQWYAQQLISVVFTEMNSGIKAITGQTETIPMFMTPDPGITAVAQLWASDINLDMHLVGPSYCYPSGVNVDVAFGNWGSYPHISADGQRWRGQKSAEAIRFVVENRRQWKPLRMTAAREQADGSIIVDFYAPFAPINIDTVTLPKQAAPVAGGFSSLYGLELIRVSDGLAQTISAISIAGATSLRIAPATALVAGAAYTIQSAWQNAADTIGVVASVRTGPTLIGIGPFVGGVRSDLPTKEIVITGNIFAKLKSLSDIGAFTVSAAGGTPNALCRKVYVEGGNTILQIRNFETNGTFAAGQTISASTIDSFTNICDSDPAQSLYEWLDPQNYTARTGPYPMMNWLVQDIDIKVTRL